MAAARSHPPAQTDARNADTSSSATGRTNAGSADASSPATGGSTVARVDSHELDHYQILGSAAEPVFDELVTLLAHRMGTPHAELTIVTPDRVWLMAATAEQGTSRLPRESLCTDVAADRRTTVIPDTKRSARFADHPRVEGPDKVRFYAGVPLISADGKAPGVLSVWDVKPQEPTADDIAMLEEFGRHAMALLELRRSRIQLDSRDALLAAHTAVLKLIVEGAALPLILDTLARAVEASIPSTTCTILLLDGGVLHHGAWPNLPAAYRDAIDGLRIGPVVGSCGTAAYTRKTVIVEDIATDPRWTDFRELALASGLRACWSVPIIGRDDEVLGTFALYYRTVRSPTDDELRQLSRWMNLAEVAISSAGDVAALRSAATLDALTGLMSRTPILQLLQEVTSTPGRGLAVLFVDLDQFKFINDTLGHAAGDQFLKAVADRLKACVGPRDTVARIGGDEFLLLCPTITRRRQAELLGHRIVTSLQQPLTIYGRSVSLSVSVGIAMHSTKAGPVSADLISDADLAMYAAKRSGRNSVAVFNDELRKRAAGRLSLEGDLSQALANNEMDCAYQPIVDLRTGELVAVEALLRWNSPTRGPLPPRSFIGTAEDSGLIFGLGEFVLRRACAQLAAWRANSETWNSVSIKINVSPRQLRDSAFAGLTEQVLASTGLPPSALGLEVTETTFIVDALLARTTLTRLRATGIQVAIDDFGTGYSALAQLKDLPTDVLKIDRQFVTDINTDAAAAGIVEAIITLARTLGLDVIAEGVETETQRRQLIELGCLYGQGYLWSPAVSPEQLVGLLRRDSSRSGTTRFSLDRVGAAD